MEDFIEGRSLRTVDGRAFWASLADINIYVNNYWDLVHKAVPHPILKPLMRNEIFRMLGDFMIPCQISLVSILPQTRLIPHIPWSRDSWVQLEIATRNLSVLLRCAPPSQTIRVVEVVVDEQHKYMIINEESLFLVYKKQ